MRKSAVIGWLVILAVFLSYAVCLYLPAARAKRSAWAAVCASNLKQIGLACHMYAMDHDGRFPDTLAELSDKYVELQCFFCPGDHGGHTGKYVNDLDSAAASYILVPGLSPSDDPDTVLAYDKSVWNHGGTGKNVCFVDGRVRFIEVDRIVEKDFDEIAGGLDSFFKNNARYPANGEGLEILVASNCLRNLPVDPFDKDGRRPYGYAVKNVHNNWILVCYGPDNDADIDLSLYSNGKLSTEDLLRLRTKSASGIFNIGRTNGDIFRVGP